MKVKTIVYKATWKAPIDDVQRMINASKKQNSMHSITGLLVFKHESNEILQHIEGPAQAIDSLWKNIQNDKRAENYETLLEVERYTDHRNYRTWMYFNIEKNEVKAIENSKQGDEWAMDRFPKVSFETRMETFESVRELGLDYLTTMRFCIARKFDEIKVKKMITDSLAWRNGIHFDSLHIEECGILQESQYLTVSRGRDKKGRIIALFDIEFFEPCKWDIGVQKIYRALHEEI